MPALFDDRRSAPSVRRRGPLERLRLLLLVGAVLLTTVSTVSTARAVTGPENVILVVNRDSWASTRLANEYMSLRKIPPQNVISLENLPSFERMDVETFRQRILLPVLKTIDARGLAGQVDAIVYSADFPTTIDVRGDLGDRKPPQVLTLDAAVNGLTYLYPLVLNKDVRYLDLQSNLYARRRVPVSTDTPWSAEERQRYGAAVEKLSVIERARRERAKPPEKPQSEKGTPDKPKPEGADPEKPQPEKPQPEKPESSAARDDAAAAERRELEASAGELRALRDLHPRAVELLYNLACLEARLDRLDESLAALTAAVEHGWFDQRHAAADPDLAPLRGREEFAKLLERMKGVEPTMQRPVSFRGAAGWSSTGEPTTRDRGVPYLVSTVLSYTSGRGLSVSEATAQLQRSARADRTAPTGTIYFPVNGDVRSTTREWGFAAAAKALEESGVRAVVEPGVLPQGKPDVAGAVIGTAGFEWTKSGSTILPGAICEHLTSFGGMLGQDAGQTPLTEFLRHGAAGASGTVTEPYAIQAKFPTPFIQVAYANGLSLGEAFYQSVSGPYQLLIVGDALCRPWGKSLEVTVEGLPDEGAIQGELQVTARLAAPGAAAPKLDEPGMAVVEWYLDGRRIGATKPGASFAIDSTRLPDGVHDLAAVGLFGDGVLAIGRRSGRIEVRNHDARLTVEPPVERRPTWDRPVTIKASLPGAAEIALRFQDRVVARIMGETGELTLDPKSIGAGPVTLQPIGRIGERAVFGEPISLEITPPAPRAARQPPAGSALHEGLELRFGEQAPRIVTDARADWLRRAEVPADTAWSLEGWFEAPSDDVYQFQLSGDLKSARLLVDDEPVDWPKGEVWWHAPVSLAKGLHRLRIESDGSPTPRLEVRFGGPGTRWLDGARFKHAKQP